VTKCLTRRTDELDLAGHRRHRTGAFLLDLAELDLDLAQRVGQRRPCLLEARIGQLEELGAAALQRLARHPGERVLQLRLGGLELLLGLLQLLEPGECFLSLQLCRAQLRAHVVTLAADPVALGGGGIALGRGHRG